jgi:hypothetical protein
MATCNWLVLGGMVALLGIPGSASGQAQTTGRSRTSLDRLRVDEPTGKVKEIDLVRGQVKIADAPPLGAAVERPALLTAAAAAAAAPTPPPAPAPRRLTAEVNQRVRELEFCRGGARSGQIEVRWRILPDGRTTNALVLEQQPTDMDIMKCARRRIEAWRFSTATPAPVDVELAYDFGRPENPASAVATSTTAPPAPAPATPAPVAPPAAPSPIASERRVPPAAEVPEGKVQARATSPGQAKAAEARVGETRVGEAKLNEARFEPGK